MADKQASEIYIETTDKLGKPITVFSTTGELKNASDFSKALKTYDDKGYSPAGFVILPSGSFQEKTRRGFEDVNQPIQEAAPGIGRTQGSIFGTGLDTIADIGPILKLAAKAGIISPEVANIPPTANRDIGGDVGEATARFAAEQVNTPGKAGAVLGTAATAPFMGPVTAATGGMGKLATLANMVKGGIGGVVGYNTGSLTAGEDFDFGKTIAEFSTAALGGGLQSVASHFLIKYAKGDMGEKVAKEIIDEFKGRYPALINNPNILDIATKSPQQIARLTTQMSKALRGGTEDATSTILKDINNTLPTALSKGKQDELRGAVRRLVVAQNNRLDNIGDDTAFLQAKDRVDTATSDLFNIIREAYPNARDISPTVMHVEGILSNVKSELGRVEEGATVLHYLRQSGAQDGWNPTTFAQTIKGEYQKEPSSMLDRIGKILGQGKSLTEMPAVKEANPQDELGGKIFQFIKNQIPGSKYLPGVRPETPPLPWSAPTKELSRPIQALQNFGASEAGQGAIRDFTEKKEK